MQKHLFGSCYYLESLLSDNGIEALKEGLLTTEEAISMPTANNLELLLSDKGYIALKEGFISFEKVQKMDLWELRKTIFNEPLEKPSNNGYSTLAD